MALLEESMVLRTGFEVLRDSWFLPFPVSPLCLLLSEDGEISAIPGAVL